MSSVAKSFRGIGTYDFLRDVGIDYKQILVRPSDLTSPSDLSVGESDLSLGDNFGGDLTTEEAFALLADATTSTLNQSLAARLSPVEERFRALSADGSSTDVAIKTFLMKDGSDSDERGIGDGDSGPTAPDHPGLLGTPVRVGGSGAPVKAGKDGAPARADKGNAPAKGEALVGSSSDEPPPIPITPHTPAPAVRIHPDPVVEDFANRFHLPAIKLEDVTPEDRALRAISGDFARKYHVMPIRFEGERLVLVVSNPFKIVDIENRLKALPEGKSYTNVAFVLDSETAVDTAIKKHYGVDLEKEAKDVEEGISVPIPESVGERGATDPRAVNFINGILASAVKADASDVHIEIVSGRIRVRFRCDGKLRVFPISEKFAKDMELQRMLIARLKILGGLDSAEHQIPQDGSFSLSIQSQAYKFRLSIGIVRDGEKAVIRILKPEGEPISLERLGIPEHLLGILRQAMHRHQGMIVVTGPTGSGKSTTNAAVLQELNQDTGINIVTAEDPVEYVIPGTNQTPINEGRGLSFSGALRSFLRQDPDVVVVGEIRDFDTAEVAIKAMQTGHLVFATLHTNGAIATIQRLVDMGIDLYKLMGPDLLTLVVAQRLVKTICPQCEKIPDPVSHQQLLDAGFSEEEAAAVKPMRGSKRDRTTGQPCRHCSETGYKGRTGLYEMLPLVPEIRRAFLRGDSADEIAALAVKMGMITLKQAAIEKVREGITTVEEVMGITTDELGF